MSSSIEKLLTSPFILDFNYGSQLQAIKELLMRNQQADVLLLDEIKRFEDMAQQTVGDENDVAVDYWVELIEKSFYQHVAHSIAAVGMIAPFMEGVFKDAFKRINQELPRNDLVRKILAMVENARMSTYLPDDLASTLKALFQYRNNLVHWGFEWPAHERQRFEQAMDRWPRDWFTVTTSDLEDWLFSMSPTFIDHCMEVAEAVTKGLREFLIDKARQENGLPMLGNTRDIRLIDLPERR